uniref:Ashwin n=1 Tax=Saccoglossus kowalevskii TaxID=10224 RepID=A0ABM0M525_SACKO|nr:PREDICTED: ashwin-like [Saccoglossus kowalevskii]
MAKESMDVDAVDLLHPETLSKSTIVKLLRQRSVRIDHPGEMTKEDLVEIFYRTVLPLPQRQFRDNRWGKMMAKLRPKKRKVNDVEKYLKNVGPSPAKRKAFGHSGGLITSADVRTSPSEMRLKPPPVVINKNKTVVKLNPSKIVSNPSSSITPEVVKLNKTKISSKTTKSDSSEFSSTNTNSESDSSTGSSKCKSSSDKSPECKKVSLKRPPSTEKSSTCEETVTKKKKVLKITSPSTGSNQISTDTSSSESPSPSKKANIRKITWP